MPTAPPNPPITIDILLAALHRSIFHPFIALLLPLCLRALASPYTSPSFILTSLFATLICLTHLLSRLNQRLTHGSPRALDWPNEIVVITGGCGGLGGCIAEIFALRGVSIAVLDIAAPAPVPPPTTHGLLKPVEKEGIHYYNIDITSPPQLSRAWSSIETHLGGAPTILINNAAIAPTGPLISVSHEEVRKVFDVNTLSHFSTTAIFLRRLSRSRGGGTIVTVASVLGELGAANLGMYCASKAALLAFHRTLRAELRRERVGGIKTVLVAPGQLDTPLFGDVRGQGWVRRFFGPVVGAGEVARRVVEMVGRGEGGEVRVPVYAGVIQWFGVLPGVVQDWLRAWSGVDEAVAGGGWGGEGGMRGGEDEEGEREIEGQDEGRGEMNDDSDSDDEYG